MLSEYSGNSLEITRNPFDSADLDRENLPGLSPSVFRSSSIGSAEKANFRWSIDQLAMLKPADIDEFPLQEYSSMYLREEEEREAQKAIDEYFSTVTLPSPWLEEKEPSRSKKVTFSPHAPTTQYFMNESYDSDKGATQPITTRTQKVDASCQTKLTFPINLDLERLLSKFTLKAYGQLANKADTSFTSFRRKLFSCEDSLSNSSPETCSSSADAVLDTSKKDAIDEELECPAVTSSPVSHKFSDDERCRSENEDVRRSSFFTDELESPSMSPLADINNNDNIAGKCRTLSTSDMQQADMSSNDEVNLMLRSAKDFDFGTNSNLGFRSTESSLQVDGVSGIGSSDRTWNANVIESTRMADIDLNSVSPIKVVESEDEEMDLSIVRNQSMESMEMSCLQESVKESTARPLHGITYLGLSPIRDSSGEGEKLVQLSESNGLSTDKIQMEERETLEDRIPETLSLSDLADEDPDDFPMEALTPRSKAHTSAYFETPRKSGPHKGILKHANRTVSGLPKYQQPSRFENFEHYLESRARNLTSTISQKSTPKGGKSRRPLREVESSRDSRHEGSSFHKKGNAVQGVHQRCTFDNQLDEDLVIRQANAALCRANELERQDIYNNPELYSSSALPSWPYHAGLFTSRPEYLSTLKPRMNDSLSNRIDASSRDSGFATLGDDCVYLSKRFSSRMDEDVPKAAKDSRPGYSLSTKEQVLGKENIRKIFSLKRKEQTRRDTWPSSRNYSESRSNFLALADTPVRPRALVTSQRCISDPVMRYQRTDRGRNR